MNARTPTNPLLLSSMLTMSTVAGHESSLGDGIDATQKLDAVSQTIVLGTYHEKMTSIFANRLVHIYAEYHDVPSLVKQIHGSGSLAVGIPSATVLYRSMLSGQLTSAVKLVERDAPTLLVLFCYMTMCQILMNGVRETSEDNGHALLLQASGIARAMDKKNLNQ